MTSRKILAGLSAATLTLAGTAMAQAQFSKSDIYFELNATDGDAGLHGILDGDAWKSAKIKGPGGTFDVIRAQSNQDSPEFGMTELFFESNEPPLEERSFAELTALFPAGLYKFVGTSTANQPMRAEDTLTTAMPCPAIVRTPRLVSGDLAISWRLQRGNYDPDSGVCSAGNAVTPIFIQAFFELSNPTTGESRKFAVDLPASARTVEVPEELLLGIDFDDFDEKAEVIVVGTGGNRTAIEVEVEL
jgi:hypothetical protein